MNEFWILILCLASAGISAIATAAYWRDKHIALLKEVAKDRRADAATIRNAKIIENVYGKTLGLDIQERRHNDLP